jgi:hypothetical protein
MSSDALGQKDSFPCWTHLTSFLKFDFVIYREQAQVFREVTRP